MNDNRTHTQRFRRQALLLFSVLVSGWLTAQSRTFHVSPAAQGNGDGSDWSNTTTLADALTRAVAGDQIWLQGFETITGADQVYAVPDANGFVVPSGVQIYGGFAGTELRADDRATLGEAYRMRFRSVLSGDVNGNDVADGSNLIFPANTSRGDNATHVLSLNMDPASGQNNNTYPTVVNGLTITGGHAVGGKGGGIYVYGDNSNGGVYRIERCYLCHNYALQGGGLYVENTVSDRNNETSSVSQCAVFNNASGQRSVPGNSGGGIYLAGAGMVSNSAVFNNENGGICLSGAATAVNATVVRNSGGGIDMLATPDDATTYNVFNSVVWGNAELYALVKPNFKNSAFYETVTRDADGNIRVNQFNNEGESPFFTAPSTRASFDRDHQGHSYPAWSWSLTEQSALIDQGDDGWYTAASATDLDGQARLNGTIDIGAYEYQPVSSTRIRYVTPDGAGTKDGSSWANASDNLQQMINELADNNPQNMAGEVWVAAGTYTPQSQVLSGTTYSASFRMRDGISVYGGFAGTETSKQDRAQGNMPWEFDHQTILEATLYVAHTLEWNTADIKWTLNSDSRHVVWFAPLPSEGTHAFKNVTRLNGVTIRGGYAQGGNGINEFLTDRGAGAYVGQNAYIENCILTENTATGNGGAVYLKGGRILHSLLYNNNANSNGGAVYVDNGGLVLSSMLSNNSANNGAAVYFDHTGPWHDGVVHPEYLLLSTSVVSNNTSRLNGAVYCNNGGIVLQSTIVNNNCPTATDRTNQNASQTGGLYINQYGLIINCVVWNNIIQGKNIPMYAKNPNVNDVRFLNNAVSGINNAVWNNTLQQDMVSLSEANSHQVDGVFSPDFSTGGQMPDDNALAANVGVQAAWTHANGGINYFWQPVTGSNLRACGMVLGNLPDEVLIKPELDIAGNLFAQKPATGAHQVEAVELDPAWVNNNTLQLYVDDSCTDPQHDGSSWATATRSLSEAISFMTSLTSGQTVAAYVNGNHVNITLPAAFSMEIYVHSGTIHPRYTFADLDPKSATIDIPAIAGGNELRLYGGYHHDKTTGNVERDPLTHRTIIDGNNTGENLSDGLFHCLTIAENNRVTIDGFHIINGYAAERAMFPYGAGLLVNKGANVTLQNCIFENNTAQEGAAMDARAATLTLNNCVVNNNTNTTAAASIINCPNLTLNHVTVVNNIGAAPANMGTSSFSAGNTAGTNSVNLASTGQNGADNFANPTNAAGATLGFDTYLGGYASFQPLTSSAEAGNTLINHATGTPTQLTTDITTQKARNLGGASDLGAYEADLPMGNIIYVNGNTGNDANDGLSWNTALQTIVAALNKAATVANINDRPQIWVAAGTYTHQSADQVHSQKYGYKMVEGVNVYGGFPATGAPGFDDRNPKQYPTILQQGTEHPDAMVANNAASFGRVLVQPNNFGAETIWDGFTLQYGYLFSCFRQNIKGDIAQVNTQQIGLTGGAGAYLMENGVLENCIIQDNIVYVYPHHANMVQTKLDTDANFVGGFHQAGAGVYNAGGTIRNCVIKGNKLQHRMVENPSGIIESAWIYGAGLYMNSGSVFNTVIADNVAEIIGKLFDSNDEFHEVVVGAGAFLVEGSFYNNTITGNKAQIFEATRKNISLGGVYVYNNINMYNCIIANNQHVAETTTHPKAILIKDYPIAAFTITGQGVDAVYNPDAQKVRVFYSCLNIAEDNPYNLAKTNDTGRTNVYATNANTLLDADYKLLPNSPAINTGTENIPGVNIPNFDAEYTARVKDCAIDMGAFERDNDDNIAFKAVTENGVTKYHYYVSQNGSGLRNGDSESNAACAEKLQQILTAAGATAAQNPDVQVCVLIAGYADGTGAFTYHATETTSATDPLSYSFLVPYGVTIMGGYSDQETNWTDANRNPLQRKTRLSAIYEGTDQDVNGYHAVTFGEKPAAWTGADRATILDGLCLTDGAATSMAGGSNPNTRGGGAIVPAWGHVRNCIVTNCTAIEGGGLYLQPGATVSGTLVQGNSAETGGGIYADNTNASPTLRAHMISCTIVDNTATGTGGGIYMEDGGLMALNSVVWGNTASADKNISGHVSNNYEDALWEVALGIDESHPFNNCYVETFELPSNFENAEMESNAGIYFTGAHRLLKEFSPLVKHGMSTAYYALLQTQAGVSATDMQGISRIQQNTTRVDVGAFAFDGGTMPTNELITRIFVSKNSELVWDGTADDSQYIGRTFYTPVASLDDALEYIRATRESGLAKDDTAFEVLVAAGTYKPNTQRVNDSVDQRINSFVVPHGVSVYGGFSGTEKISSDGITSVPGITGAFTPDQPIDDIRPAQASDFNQNGVGEAWELAHQTILSGEVSVSQTAKNAYHVIYSKADNVANPLPVVLDGLTIMSGETATRIDNAHHEIGRGAGIYSDGVPYTVNRCRFLNNYAMRGGAIYVRDAERLNIIGSMLSGNGTVENPETTDNLAGGAVCLSNTPLYAVNTLWTNNETGGAGGAIAISGTGAVSLANNTFARNKAQTDAVIDCAAATANILNTAMWGNEGGNTFGTNFTITYSASDIDLRPDNTNHNLHLDTENMSANGPRFKNPSTVAGVAGYEAHLLWSPGSVSVMTDAGDGEQAPTGTLIGGYNDWWNNAGLTAIHNQYMLKLDNADEYARYSSPRREDGTEQAKTIDIGMYEYQFNHFPLDYVYVATTDAGLADGSSWGNATSDLRGAIIAMANPEGTDQTTIKHVYIKGGEYASNTLSASTAYTLSMSDATNTYGTALNIKGSYNNSGVQNFAQPTIISTDPSNQDKTETLLVVETNVKPVLIEGVTFTNKNTGNGNAISVNTQAGGKLTLKNTAFRGNKGKGVMITQNAGSLLIANTLFADGGTGLDGNDTQGDITVVNSTFVNNLVDYDHTSKAPNIYNSVAWNNAGQKLMNSTENNNVAIDGTIANDDIMRGPNFKDPDNADIYQRDYSIRPGNILLNRGNNQHYLDHVSVDLTDEKDLGNNKRLIDNNIDIGAYEYEAALQPIVYVKADLTGTADGQSWATALSDLQGAINLAGLYAATHAGKNGYVFVHSNYNATTPINITLANVKVYGTMNDETADRPLANDFSNTDEVVAQLLGKHKGLLESAERSRLTNLTIGANSVVDGFEITNQATINSGQLSTSIAQNGVSGTGIVYNSFVQGNVSTATAANVTATGDITSAAGGNNRANVTETNSYVTADYWKYQLMETSTDIDPADSRTDISTYIAAAGHNRDLIGNLRVRNTVDNGCFETWNITTPTTITAADHPVGQSVVYVRKGIELTATNGLYIDAASAFSPGFLLLEHQAGLRSNGNHITLNNYAMERDIPANGADLTALPFTADATRSLLHGLTPKRYDGSIRAAYSYKFDANNSTAWTEIANIEAAGIAQGMLFENTTADNLTLRFYGKNAYTETGTAKNVSLTKYNFNESWAAPDAAGNKFTHKENMSWNLFGSPFLCALNYGDMEYGRVIYGYDGGYTTANTYSLTNGATASGHIPAGNAVFTQSATLKTEETFRIAVPTGTIDGTAFFSQRSMALFVDQTDNTTLNALADICVLQAVPADEASTTFDLGSDGVKWMSSGDKPQIYALRDGGRYSLLSAVNEDAETDLGLLLPAAGTYVIGIGEGSDRQAYEAVILIDRLTGLYTDLLDGKHAFNTAQGGTLDDRFRITFNPAAANTGNGPFIRIFPEGRVLVGGITDGQSVTAYNASGMTVQQLPATESHVWFTLPQGFYVFRVRYADDSGHTLKAVVP